MQFQHLTENLSRDADYLDRRIDETKAADFLGYTIRAIQKWRVRRVGPKFVLQILFAEVVKLSVRFEFVQDTQDCVISIFIT